VNAVVPLRLGILGCGMIGHAFAAQARALLEVVVTAICSPRETSRHRVAEIWPAARQYRDRDALLADADVRAVLVCTPHRNHAADAIAALDAGKHVLIEKPIGTCLKQLDALEAAAKRNPDAAVLALPLPPTPALSVVRELSQESRIGKVMELGSCLDVPGPPRSNWYYSRAAVGGPSLDTLPYALGRLLVLTGPTLAEVAALVTQAIRRRRCEDGGQIEQEVEDSVTLLLSFRTGQQAIVKSSWCISRPEDYLLVRGRSGDLRLDCSRATLLVRATAPPELPYRVVDWDGQPAYLATLPSRHPEQAKLLAFADLVRRRGTTLPETAFVMRLILGALAIRHGSVPIPTATHAAAEPALPGMLVGEGYV
jgi:predicted dehydrogenase